MVCLGSNPCAPPRLHYSYPNLVLPQWRSSMEVLSLGNVVRFCSLLGRNLADKVSRTHVASSQIRPG